MYLWEGRPTNLQVVARSILCISLAMTLHAACWSSIAQITLIQLTNNTRLKFCTKMTVLHKLKARCRTVITIIMQLFKWILVWLKYNGRQLFIMVHCLTVLLRKFVRINIGWFEFPALIGANFLVFLVHAQFWYLFRKYASVFEIWKIREGFAKSSYSQTIYKQCKES